MSKQTNFLRFSKKKITDFQILIKISFLRSIAVLCDSESDHFLTDSDLTKMKTRIPFILETKKHSFFNPVGENFPIVQKQLNLIKFHFLTVQFGEI